MPKKTLSQKALKAHLDHLADHYHVHDFIDNDPMRFAHPFRHDLHRCEANSLLAAFLSYGRRETIIAKLTELFDRLEAPVYDVLKGDLEPVEKRLRGFVYRFNTGRDIYNLLTWWKDFYERHDSHLDALKRLAGGFPLPCPPPKGEGVKREAIIQRQHMQSLMHEWLSLWLPDDFLHGRYSYGTRYLVPHPATGGACKRIHMALRWLCRDDSHMGENAVDFGLWSEVIPPSALMMPMDTHVGRLSREWGMLTRKSTDWKSAEELTARLAKMCPEDPCRYDFAFLGFGVDEVRGRV